MRHFHLLPPFIRRFGMIPESYKIAMTYEEQLLWLCKYVEDLGLEIENIKTALLNIENAVNELDTRLTGLSERVDAIAVDLAYVQTVLDNGYIINLLNQNYTLDSFYSSFGIKGYFYTGSYVIRNNNDSIVIDTDTLFYYDYETKSFKIFENRDEVIHRFIFFDNVDEEWKDYTYNIVDFVNQSSSPTQIPNARAVYNAILEAIGGGITISYDSLSNLPTINGVTVIGNLTSQDLGLDSGFTLIDSNSNIWELPEGLYKVEQGIELSYSSDGLGTYEAQNEYAYLLVGKSQTDDIWNYMIFDKSSVNDLSSAVFCGYSRITEQSPNFTVIGNCVEQVSNNTDWESRTNKISEITALNKQNTNLYTSAKAVADYVDSQVGNIETLLNNINVGSGVI